MAAALLFLSAEKVGASCDSSDSLAHIWKTNSHLEPRSFLGCQYIDPVRKEQNDAMSDLTHAHYVHIL